MGGRQGRSAQTDSLANAVGHHSLVQRSLEVGPTEDVENSSFPREAHSRCLSPSNQVVGVGRAIGLQLLRWWPTGFVLGGNKQNRNMPQLHDTVKA